MNCLGDTGHGLSASPLVARRRTGLRRRRPSSYRDGHATYVGLGLNSTLKKGFDNLSNHDLIDTAGYSSAVSNTEQIYLYYFTRARAGRVDGRARSIASTEEDGLPFCANPNDPTHVPATSVRLYSPGYKARAGCSRHAAAFAAYVAVRTSPPTSLDARRLRRRLTLTRRIARTGRARSVWPSLQVRMGDQTTSHLFAIAAVWLEKPLCSAQRKRLQAQISGFDVKNTRALPAADNTPTARRQ